MAVRGITFDNQLLKSEDFAHQTNCFYQGKMGVTKGCEISIDANRDLVVADGYFIIFGRQVANVGDTVVKVPTVASGTLYSKLVFTIDLTLENTETEFNQGYFEIISNSVAYPNLIQEDLDNGGTKYQLEFYKFANTVPGITNGVDTRTLLDLSVYALGEDLGNVDNLKTAAKTAVGGINELNDDLAKKAPIHNPILTGAPWAPTAEVSNSSPRIATTEFVQDCFDSRILYCEAKNISDAVSLSNKTWRSIRTDQILAGSEHGFTVANNRVAMPAKGNLIINVQARFDDNSVGDRGIAVERGSHMVGSATVMRRACSATYTRLNEAFNLPVNQGDLINFQAFQNSGGNLNLTAMRVCMTLIAN